MPYGSSHDILIFITYAQKHPFNAPAGVCSGPRYVNVDLSAHLQTYTIALYQSPLILIELFQHNLINVSYLTACYLYQVMMTLHFLNDVAYDSESTQKSKITS